MNMETECKIDILGHMSPGLSTHIHLEDYVYSPQGVSRTLCGRDYKDPIRILVEVNNDK
jgi:hypothetical protein